MTIEMLCEKLNIKGLITYTESDKYIGFRYNGKQYVYNKLTDNLIVVD